MLLPYSKNAISTVYKKEAFKASFLIKFKN